jgi:hypothetical protein
MTFKANIAFYFLGDLVTIIACTIELFLDEVGGPDEIIFNYIVIVIQLNRFVDIYNALVIMLISFKYKNTVNLIGFLNKLFVILHVCVPIFTTHAIIVYAVTLLDLETNWLKKIGKVGSDRLTQYIYSVYFTGTTMFTVGYGDIIPQNNIEIIVIMLIQLLGIVVIGYIISEIGHTLTTMRQARDDF